MGLYVQSSIVASGTPRTKRDCFYQSVGTPSQLAESGIAALSSMFISNERAVDALTGYKAAPMARNCEAAPHFVAVLIRYLTHTSVAK